VCYRPFDILSGNWLMAYPLLTMAQIRADMLRDIRNLLPEADVGPDSDYFIRASSVASGGRPVPASGVDGAADLPRHRRP
jgi:hypothetical protein